MSRRVAITGMGAITSLGQDPQTMWAALLRGESRVTEMTHFDTTGFTTRIAAQVNGFDPSAYIDRKHLRHMDRFVQFAAVAALQAVRDAGLEITDANRHRVGVCLGSGIGGIATWDRDYHILLTKGPGRVSPFFIPMMIGNMAAGHVSILIGARGPNKACVTACATGAHSIGDAFRLIKYGDAEVMIAGGTEAPLQPLGVAGFCSMKALSTRNDAPNEASRPFDRDRDGFVMAEGAGVVVLEEMEHARRRGARIYAELAGYGMSGDAYNLYAPLPCGSGAASAMLAALQEAELRPTDIDYINPHAPSTPAGDATEVVAIKKAFGPHAYEIPVSSTKSMTGHLLGAAGGVELIICALALRDNVVPPTINYETPDPDCDLDCVPNEPREVRIDAALSNSFGFGGQNASLVIKRV